MDKIFSDYGITISKVKDKDIYYIEYSNTRVKDGYKRKEITIEQAKKAMSSAKDAEDIINILNLEKGYDFGAKPSEFNLLNTPDSAYVSLEQFWNEYNKEFIDQAVLRGDDIILATNPTIETLGTYPNNLTGFGREYYYLKEVCGYIFDSKSCCMIKP